MPLNINMDPLQKGMQHQAMAPAMPQGQQGPSLGGQLAGKAAGQLAAKEVAKLGLGAAGTAMGGPVGGALGTAAGEMAGPLVGQLVSGFFNDGGEVPSDGWTPTAWQPQAVENGNPWAQGGGQGGWQAPLQRGGGNVLGNAGPSSRGDAQVTPGSTESDFSFAGRQSDAVRSGKTDEITGALGGLTNPESFAKRLGFDSIAAYAKDRAGKVWDLSSKKQKEAMKKKYAADLKKQEQAAQIKQRDAGGTANIRAPLGQDWTGVLDASGLGEGHGGIDRVGAEYNVGDNTTVGGSYSPEGQQYNAGITHKFNTGGPVYKDIGGLIAAGSPLAELAYKGAKGVLSNLWSNDGQAKKQDAAKMKFSKDAEHKNTGGFMTYNGGGEAKMPSPTNAIMTGPLSLDHMKEMKKLGGALSGIKYSNSGGDVKEDMHLTFHDPNKGPLSGGSNS